MWIPRDGTGSGRYIWIGVAQDNCTYMDLELDEFDFQEDTTLLIDEALVACSRKQEGVGLRLMSIIN